MIELSRDVVLTEVDGEAVVLDGRRGRYWHLNATAQTMLERLLAGDTPDEVAQHLGDAVARPAADLVKDVDALVRELSKANLVDVR